jgi:hypothetical protein
MTVGIPLIKEFVGTDSVCNDGARRASSPGKLPARLLEGKFKCVYSPRLLHGDNRLRVYQRHSFSSVNHPSLRRHWAPDVLW